VKVNFSRFGQNSLGLRSSQLLETRYWTFEFT
jgi:hypothetical protein